PRSLGVGRRPGGKLAADMAPAGIPASPRTGRCSGAYVLASKWPAEGVGCPSLSRVGKKPATSDNRTRGQITRFGMFGNPGSACGPGLEVATMGRAKLRPGTVRSQPLLLADERGVALVEFALVLPLLLLLLLGMIDVGKAVNYWNDETHLANEAARYAAVNKNPGPQSTLNQSILNQADTTELKNGGTTSLPAGETICIWF